MKPVPVRVSMNEEDILNKLHTAAPGLGWLDSFTTQPMQFWAYHRLALIYLLLESTVW